MVLSISSCMKGSNYRLLHIWSICICWHLKAILQFWNHSRPSLCFTSLKWIAFNTVARLRTLSIFTKKAKLWESSSDILFKIGRKKEKKNLLYNNLQEYTECLHSYNRWTWVIPIALYRQLTTRMTFTIHVCVPATLPQSKPAFELLMFVIR